MRIYLWLTLSLFLSSFLAQVSAHPAFFKQYKEHSRALEKADCSICHFDPNGGGKLQEFGLDFAQAEYNITQKMLKLYPSRFKQQENPALDHQ